MHGDNLHAAGVRPVLQSLLLKFHIVLDLEKEDNILSFANFENISANIAWKIGWISDD